MHIIGYILKMLIKKRDLSVRSETQFDLAEKKSKLITMI